MAVDPRTGLGTHVQNLARIATEQFDELAKENSILWIGEIPRAPTDDNDAVRGTTGVNQVAVGAASAFRLTGKGIKIAQFQEGMKEIDAKYPPASISDYVDHIEHAVKVAGIGHVGIGSDFDGGGGVPGFNDHSEAFNVTIELVRRGYSEEDILKIWGANLLRLWREVEKVSQELQKGSNNG